MPEYSVDPLIKTKLFVPQMHHELVKRARISAYLNNGLQYPLLLVSSIAGSGKTTALAQWVSQLQMPAAWLSLDEGDNDLARFFRYLVAALQTVAPGAGTTALEAFWSSEPPPIEILVTYLINDLAEGTTDFVVILDDFHFIQDRSIHQAVAFLVDHQPSQMHLVIATRMDARLPLTRLRARHKILELRIDRLRFTPPETAEYLNQVMGLDLAEDDLGTLLARTEGWVASLQMAALSLKNTPDGKAFIQAFSGSNRYIMDYLVEEVLNFQPEYVQAFLLQTSLLERFCGPLCDALYGRKGENGGQAVSQPSNSGTPAVGCASQEMLEYLERSNLFIVALDNERKWYRYHHLFVDLLRNRLARPFRIKSGAGAGQSQQELHIRAAEWYESNGFLENAIHHALAAPDYPRLARLIESGAENLWLNGEYSRLLGWIGALPEELIRQRPWLCIWNAWSLTQTSTQPEADAWIDTAQRAIEQQAVANHPALPRLNFKQCGTKSPL